MRKHIALRALLLTALLTGTASWTPAQVAVPELAPAGVRIFNSRFPLPTSTISPITPMNTIVPENPAALQWGAPSRIGGGALEGNMSDVADGDSTRYSGSFAGFRWIKQRVALAADTLDYSVQLKNSGGVLTDLERKRQSVALSFSLPESLAWGVGSRSLTFDETKPGVSHVDSSGWNVGLSWRIGQILFIGGGLGHDTASAKLPPPPPPAPPIPFVGDIERDYRMAGIGLRGTGSVVWHLEADSIHHEPFVDAAGKPRLPGYDLALYVGEVQFGNWLFGYSQHAIKDLKPEGVRINGYTADFGFAPFEGLSITGRSELTRREFGGSQKTFERVNSASVLWQF